MHSDSTCLRSQRTRHGGGDAPSFPGWPWMDPPGRILSLAHCTCTCALVGDRRGTGTQRNSSAAGRRRCPLPLVVATHGAAAAPGPSDGYPPAPDAAQLDGARPPRCHGATARFGVRSLYSHRQGTVPSHLSAKFS